MNNTNNLRQLKVYSSTNRYEDGKIAPCIRIEGKWLSDFGFNIGDYITVKCEDGKFIITRDDDRKASESKHEQEVIKQLKQFNDKDLNIIKKAIRDM